MSLKDDLMARAENKCELCTSTDKLEIFEVGPDSDGSADQSVLLCDICRNPGKSDVHHWRCLGDSMWTPVPAVQVLAWRMLNQLTDEAWARDLLDMLYLDEETEIWAKAGMVKAEEPAIETAIVHKDSNGATLSAGDTVVLIKDLNVKGAGFTAKRGTAVRNISLVEDNEAHIEGRVEGQQIVILTEFVKKK
ncbi:MAG: PhnA domain-containing protein [Emcibacteraceae bacterium]|nr:PhnA domain-containing protein [Emcibacteraceae bacterium]